MIRYSIFRTNRYSTNCFPHNLLSRVSRIPAFPSVSIVRNKILQTNREANRVNKRSGIQRKPPLVLRSYEREKRNYKTRLIYSPQIPRRDHLDLKNPQDAHQWCIKLLIKSDTPRFFTQHVFSRKSKDNASSNLSNDQMENWRWNSEK